MTTKVDVDVRLLPGIEGKSVRAVLPKLRRLRRDIEATAHRLCPKDSGHLDESIYSDLDLVDGVITVGATASYAYDVEVGTGPHDIYPDTRDRLRFRGSDGDIHFAKVVHHPGTKPQSFLRGALNLHRGRVE